MFEEYEDLSGRCQSSDVLEVSSAEVAIKLAVGAAILWHDFRDTLAFRNTPVSSPQVETQSCQHTGAALASGRPNPYSNLAFQKPRDVVWNCSAYIRGLVPVGHG